MSFHIDSDKLLGNYKTVSTKNEDLQVLNFMLYQYMMMDI